MDDCKSHIPNWYRKLQTEFAVTSYFVGGPDHQRNSYRDCMGKTERSPGNDDEVFRFRPASGLF